MIYCILAYPALVHLSVLLGQPVLAGAALVALYCAFAFRGLRAGRPGAWAGFAIAAAASAAAVHQGAQWYALYLPPVVLPLALLAWWAPTLRRGQTPFVTRLAIAIRGEVSPEHAAYTRGVTVMWVVVFAVLAVAGLVTALWASTGTWSLVTNVLNPAFLGLVFLVEYLYRRWHLRHEPHPGFLAFLRQIARAGVRPGT